MNHIMIYGITLESQHAKLLREIEPSMCLVFAEDAKKWKSKHGNRRNCIFYATKDLWRNNVRPHAASQS